MSNLYDKDFPAWAEETAHLLTERRFEEIDLEALIDEVQDLSRREKETVKSFLETIIEHLLKLAYAPDPIFHNNLNGWTSTVRRTRRKLGEKLGRAACSRIMRPKRSTMLTRAGCTIRWDRRPILVRWSGPKSAHGPSNRCSTPIFSRAGKRASFEGPTLTFFYVTRSAPK